MTNYIKYTFQSMAALMVLLALTFITACEEDGMEASSEVELLSFGPSGVKHGDEIVFIGSNLNKVSSITFQPEVEVTADGFTSHTSGQIKLNVPQAVEAGLVMLKTTDGDTIQSKSILNFEVPVVISGITAEAKPGTNVTITGEKINWIESVTFTSDLTIEKADFVSQGQTELVVQVPMEAQSGYLIFSTGGTEPLTFGSEEQLVVSLPDVTSLSPSSIRHTNDLSIVGTDLDLVTEAIFGGDISILKADFKSQSETEIVVTVPSSVETGSITLKQLSPVDVVTEQELSIVLPVASSVSPSPAVPGTDVMTITGTDLDLVGEIILPGAGSISTFDSQSETEIVFSIPATATQGPLSYVTIHGYEAPLEGALLKLPPTGGFPTLDYYIYNDGLQNGWEAYGGWGHVEQDYQNDENPASGDYAIKSVFNDAYGAIQINNTSGPDVFAGYNYLVFYVLVSGEESDIIAQIGENGDYYPPHFTGDEYHQIVVPLADLEGSDNVNDLRIKNNNADAADNNTTVYIDEIGLTVEEPLGLLPEIVTFIYEDAVESPFVEGGWGGATTDFANEENTRGGDVAIKATFAGGWSGNAQMATYDSDPITTSGMEYLAFSIYGIDESTDGLTLQILVKPDPEEDAASQQVTLKAGAWTDYQIPLADLGNPATIGEIAFQDTDWSGEGAVYIDHIGLQ